MGIVKEVRKFFWQFLKFSIMCYRFGVSGLVVVRVVFEGRGMDFWIFRIFGQRLDFFLFRQVSFIQFFLEVGLGMIVLFLFIQRYCRFVLLKNKFFFIDLFQCKGKNNLRISKVQIGVGDRQQENSYGWEVFGFFF